jgi:hypothetical protein
MTAITAAGVGEWRFVGVQLDDGFALANLAGLAFVAGATQSIIDMRYGCNLSFGEIEVRHYIASSVLCQVLKRKYTLGGYLLQL